LSAQIPEARDLLEILTSEQVLFINRLFLNFQVYIDGVASLFGSKYVAIVDLALIGVSEAGVVMPAITERYWCCSSHFSQSSESHPCCLAQASIDLRRITQIIRLPRALHLDKSLVILIRPLTSSIDLKSITLLIFIHFMLKVYQAAHRAAHNKIRQKKLREVS
jgi:hypothetical protein